MRRAPLSIPRTIQETGLSEQFLLDSVLRTLYVLGLETASQVAKEIKLRQSLVETLLGVLRKQSLVMSPGTAHQPHILRYALTARGREKSVELLRQSGYCGPLPVPLAAFQAQVRRQSITNESIGADDLRKAFSHFVFPESLLDQLGPALNTAKPILLYGASGNGKSSIAEALVDVFEQTVYLPYCIEVDRQIIKIYDSAVHQEILEETPQLSNTASIRIDSSSLDPRWVRCRRPLIISGGELTLSMLDLDFDPISRDYEAPLQLKATGGVFCIDDLGRQLVRSSDLLNRWIVPLERRIDYLTLRTGKKFEIPFDAIIVFSTNLSPGQIIGEAIQRRISYKIKVHAPELRDYETIFRRTCELNGLDFTRDFLNDLVNDFYKKNNLPLAAFHPRMFVEHAVAFCNYKGIPPQLNREVLKRVQDGLLLSLDERSKQS